MNPSMKEHWDEIYEALDADELTWYEEIPEPSIRLLCQLPNPKGLGRALHRRFIVTCGCSGVIYCHRNMTQTIQFREYSRRFQGARFISALEGRRVLYPLTPRTKCQINKDESIMDVGAGASTFIDYLLNQGFKNIIAVDISEIALNKIKERLGKEKASSVRWIVDDITEPVHIQELRDIAVWHDRAVLHFLLEEKQQKVYLSTLKKALKNKGYVIIAAFSLKGAKKCTGLDVKNYDQDLLVEFLGEEFKLLEYFDHTYHMPSGEPRPYIYTLFQKA